jgi:hypothetical protein
VTSPRRAGGGGGRRWSGGLLGRSWEAAGGWEVQAGTGGAPGGISEGNGGLDVAVHGDPEFTGGRGWAVEAKGARSGFGKQTSGANEASGSC